MMAFILAALLLSLIAAAFLARPLLRPQAGEKSAPRLALLCAVVLGAAGALVYFKLGSRSWSDPAVQAQSGRTIADLARELEHHPQDLSGWLALGQAYSDIGRYSIAQRSFERANRLAPGGNAEAMAGIAETMLLGGDSTQMATAQEYLERALQLDPHSPKALFYGAVGAYQAGRLDVARDRFSAMLALNPPEGVRVALQRQIDDITKQLADAPAANAAPKSGANTSAAGAKASDSTTAIHLHVTLAAALRGKVPADAALYVFVRSPDGGAPLAVKRSALRLPQDIELSAADAMIAGHAVKPGQNVAVVARISVSGNPLPQSGDLYGEISTVAGQSGSRALQIDRLNP
jgi:cytochrome c-type biogenesis protein CcmH